MSLCRPGTGGRCRREASVALALARSLKCTQRRQSPCTPQRETVLMRHES